MTPFNCQFYQKDGVRMSNHSVDSIFIVDDDPRELPCCRDC